jgi:hypothetical protein
MASRRSQSAKALTRFGGTSAVGIVTRKPDPAVSTRIMARTCRAESVR